MNTVFVTVHYFMHVSYHLLPERCAIALTELTHSTLFIIRFCGHLFFFSAVSVKVLSLTVVFSTYVIQSLSKLISTIIIIIIIVIIILSCRVGNGRQLYMFIRYGKRVDVRTRAYRTHSSVQCSLVYISSESSTCTAYTDSVCSCNVSCEIFYH